MGLDGLIIFCSVVLWLIHFKEVNYEVIVEMTLSKLFLLLFKTVHCGLRVLNSNALLLVERIRVVQSVFSSVCYC